MRDSSQSPGTRLFQVFSASRSWCQTRVQKGFQDWDAPGSHSIRTWKNQNLQFRLVVLRQVAHVLNCVTKDSRERQIPLPLISPVRISGLGCSRVSLHQDMEKPKPFQEEKVGVGRAVLPGECPSFSVQPGTLISSSV